MIHPLTKADLSRLTFRVQSVTTGRWENVALSELSNDEFQRYAARVWPEMLPVLGGEWTMEKRLSFCNALQLRDNLPLQERTAW